MLDKLPSLPYDATKPGPVCPQIRLKGPQFWSAEDAQSSFRVQAPEEDEYACLNLTITMPVDLNGKCPVLIFIHGGALMLGSNSVQVEGIELFDAYDLVSKSIERGSKIVVVAINYRVGALGFIASQELFDYNASFKEPLGNYGLHDQRRAFDWVIAFIDGFGGDPDNITIHGTSAGAVSCHLQTLMPDPQFKRAILSSGNFYTLPPRTLVQHQPLFQRLCDSLLTTAGCTNLESVIGAPVRSVVDAMKLATINPVVDGTFILDSRLEANTARGKGPDLMIGCTAYEHDVVAVVTLDVASEILKPLFGTSLIDRIRELLDERSLLAPSNFPFSTTALLRSYGITSDRPEENRESWILLISDIMFRASTIATAKTSPQDVYIYNMKAVSPYPFSTSTYLKAHHGINDMFLFNPAPEIVAQELADSFLATVDAFQTAVTDFCHGKQPWAKYLRDKENAGPVFVFDQGGQFKICGKGENAFEPEEWSRWQEVFQVAFGCKS